MAGERFGRYEVIAPIGKGGMGEVVLARAASGDTSLVALKVLDEDSSQKDSKVAMFMDEASIMAQIQHPNVLRVIDFGRDHDRYYIAMEYLQGQPIAKVLVASHEKYGQFDRGVLSVVGARAARGLHAAHVAVGSDGVSLGVVHRDISPENLFITYEGATKVIDFGIARANQRFTRTVAGVFKGKAAYMSPEQIHERQIDGRADVFALGVCLWEMASGQRLFLRTDQFETMRAVVEAPIEPPTKGEDQRLDEIVLACLERNPADRPLADEVSSELIAYAQNCRPIATDALVAALIQSLYPDEVAAARALLQKHAAIQVVHKTSWSPGHDLYAAPPEERGGAVKSAVDALATNLAPLEQRQMEEHRIVTASGLAPEKGTPWRAAALLVLLIVAAAGLGYWQFLR
jgi:eukaryotic-like serine/threonine-protein kinase